MTLYRTTMTIIGLILIAIGIFFLTWNKEYYASMALIDYWGYLLKIVPLPGTMIIGGALLAVFHGPKERERDEISDQVDLFLERFVQSWNNRQFPWVRLSLLGFIVIWTAIAAFNWHSEDGQLICLAISFVCTITALVLWWQAGWKWATVTDEQEAQKLTVNSRARKDRVS